MERMLLISNIRLPLPFLTEVSQEMIQPCKTTLNSLQKKNILYFDKLPYLHNFLSDNNKGSKRQE